MTNETKSAIFEKYKEWRLLTDEEKINKGFPLTMRDFAITHGVSHQTLYNWNDKIDAETKQISGDFNLKGYLNENLQSIAESLVDIIKTKRNTKSIELALKALGELVEKREELHKFELTPDDKVRIARETLDGLREYYQRTGGFCPVCRRPEAICDRPVLDTEPEQPEDREVAAVAVPTRPD